MFCKELLLGNAIIGNTVITFHMENFHLVSWKQAEGASSNPVLINIFINDPSDGAEFTFSKVADDTTLPCFSMGEAADISEGAAAIQRDLDRLQKWAERNPVQLALQTHLGGKHLGRI